MLPHEKSDVHDDDDDEDDYEAYCEYHAFLSHDWKDVGVAPIIFTIFTFSQFYNRSMDTK